MTDGSPILTPEAADAAPSPIVVGIGTSAGGLAALKQLLGALRPNTGLAYVVVTHLSPEHESQLAELLQSHVEIPIQQVSTTVELEPDRVYVIPPNANLNAIDTHLRLSELEERRQERAPIDHFFRTLARTHKRHAIGVILTGTGSDGALGLKEIKETGGLAVVQDPEEAEHDGMPRSAIATGVVDLVLPVAGILDAVLQYTRTEPRVWAAEGESEEGDETAEIMADVFAHLRSRTGRDFGPYKGTTTMRRIARRMQVHNLEELDDYLAIVRDDPEEAEALADDLLITVTSFFRDREVFEVLERDVVPRLFEGKGPGDEVRVWSVGCATGEEAYSLAMLLLEEGARRENPPGVQVFASDLHERSLQRAREGFYPGEIASDVTQGRLTRFFLNETGGYRVRPELRNVVVFSPHNLLGDPPFSRLDLVACRNVLIYLQSDVQKAVVELFHYALEPDGFLVLGTSETVGDSGLFRVEDKPHRVYRKRNTKVPRPRLPVFPLARTGRPAPGERPARASRSVAYGALHHQLVERYAPPSLLINAEDEVVHLSAHVGRYLDHPGGELTARIHRLIREELRPGLQAGLHEVRSTNEPLRTAPVPVRFHGQTRPVALDIRPAVGQEDEGYALVIFDEREALPEAPDGATEASDEAGATEPDSPDVGRLMAERDRATQQLEAVIQKYETNREEMRAYTEELQSTNEELRSTMEELETSKEELQSTNEELQSVNQEARHKVEELAQLSSDLQNLLTATEIATIFLDRELRILRFTPKVGQLFNVRMTDRGRPLADLTHRLADSAIVDRARQVLETLTPIEREVVDEAGRWYLTRVLPYRSVNDRIEGVVITFIDITTRKRAEEALRESEERYRALADLSPDAILVNLDGRIMYANAAAADLVGAGSPRDIEGRSPFDFFAAKHHEEARERFRRVLDDEASAPPVEYQWERMDGNVIDVEAAPGPVRWNGLPGVQLVARDITQRKALEAQLRQGQKMQAIGHLAGGVAHDFNNLLTAVQGHASLMLDDLPDDSPLRDDVEQILNAGQRAATLTDQLLAFSRKQDLEEEAVGLGRVTTDLAKMLWRLVPERIEFRMQAAEDDPVVRADPGQLQQLVVNLVVNAVDAITDEGSISVEVDAVDLSPDEAEAIPWHVEPGEYARLTVRDTGTGMSAETAAQAFDPFFTTKGVGHGTGLGLSTVYGIVKQSRGHVMVDSTPGEGTTFRVLLPRSADTPVREPERSAAELKEEGGTVLLVEDDEAVRGVARRILDRAGYTVVEAVDGRDALEQLERHRGAIELVLSDVVMPRLGGVELKKRLAADRPDLKVVLMSGYSETEVQQDMREMAVAFLHKPFTPAALRRCVAEAFANVS